MKPSQRIIEDIKKKDTEYINLGTGMIGLILDEMREQLDELQAWRNSVKDQLL